MLENKKQIFTLALVFIASGLLLFFSSCTKNKNTYLDYSYGVGISSDYVNVQHLSISIANTYFKAIYDTALINNGFSEIDGADVLYYPDSIVKLKFTYGWWGVPDGYGNRRGGVIKVVASDGFFSETENANFIFEDYHFSKDTIRAKNYSIKYLGKIDGNDNFQMISDSVNRIIDDSTGVIVFNSSQIFTVFRESPYGLPNKLSVSGIMTGSSREGNNFETSVNTNIISDLNCNWMKQGNVEVLFDGSEFIGTVVYNPIDVCENKYNLIIDGIYFPSAIEKPKVQ